MWYSSVRTKTTEGFSAKHRIWISLDENDGVIQIETRILAPGDIDTMMKKVFTWNGKSLYWNIASYRLSTFFTFLAMISDAINKGVPHA